MATKPDSPTVAETTFAPFKLATNLLMSIMLMWFVHAALQVAYIRHQGLIPVEHIQAELNRIIPQSDPTGLAAKVAHATTDLVLVQFQAHRLIPAKSSAEPDGADRRVGAAVQRGVWAAFRLEIQVLIYSSILFAAKLGLVATLIPIFVLWMVAFAVDGLVQRSIRRSCGGYESATIYHRAKLYGFKLVLPFAAVVFLCTPVGFEPAYLFIPVALFCAYLIRLQATYYKKYL